jgi:iron complex outermembrane receptor protein
MNLRRFHIIMLFWFFCAMSLQAQEADGGRKYVTEAEAAYDIGKVEEAMSMLEGRVQSMSSSYRLRGYRLLSLCCLALDQPDEARRYATLVLKENPYYTPTVDYSPRFVDMIAEIRQGLTATITTASSQSESVNEAPSPVTIITAEMIEELGYNKNLNQILAAYVPGMVETCPRYIGENLATHSAYSYNQELILIMENGHRLNSREDNIGPTSYSISTEKIDHIVHRVFYCRKLVVQRDPDRLKSSFCRMPPSILELLRNRAPYDPN